MKILVLRPLLLGLFLFLGKNSVLSQNTFTGKVVGVSDGDTVSVMLDGKAERIRLAGIDCPESHQDFGRVATKYVSERIFGAVVEVRWKNRDRYGRIIGDIHYGEGKWLNHELVEAGLAWHYKQYSKDARLAKAEVEARAAKRSLWSRTDAVAPWEFRRGGAVKGAGEGASVSTITEDKDGTIFITRTGKSFHAGRCRHLATSKIPIDRNEAEKKGYTPCGVCSP